MKVFVAGATGAIGRPLVRQLLDARHEVSAITRSPERASALRTEGVDATVGNALDPGTLTGVFERVKPEAVVDQLTTFPASLNMIKSLRDMRQTNRLRTDGTRVIMHAAREAGVRRVVGQSIAFLYAFGETPRTEQDTYLSDAKGGFGGFKAIGQLEREVLAGGGVALRYGGWYGPGTHFSPEGMITKLVRRRMLPAPKGRGVYNALHVDDAASATIRALTAPPGVYNIVDDDPAPFPEWLGAFARSIGAKRPVTLPPFVARAMGGYFRMLFADQPPVSNEKARRELGWAPAVHWRDRLGAR